MAQAEGISRLVSPREATIANRFVALLARKGDAWKIAEIRDFPAPAASVTPYERLKELEWMVGEWVDESEDVQVNSTVRWGQGKAYLVRDYSVQIKGEPATSGLMIIAWDPQTQQIRSWIFNADGSRGDASWTCATNNQWVVKARGSTGDGQPTSATQVISLINKDAIRTSSADRIIGDEIASDLDDIIMVRKPRAPGAEVTSPKPATPSRRHRQSNSAHALLRRGLLGCSRRSASFSQQCWYLAPSARPRWPSAGAEAADGRRGAADVAAHAGAAAVPAACRGPRGGPAVEAEAACRDPRDVPAEAEAACRGPRGVPEAEAACHDPRGVPAAAACRDPRLAPAGTGLAAPAVATVPAELPGIALVPVSAAVRVRV